MCTGAEVALLSTAVTAGSAIAQGQQQKKSFKAQAQSQRNRAQEAEDIAKVKGEQHREQARRVAASARAAMAASGLSLDSESANLINKDIIERGELDAANTEFDGADAASKLRFAASLDSMRGSQASTAGFVNAGTSALGNYARYKNGWYGSPGGKE